MFFVFFFSYSHHRRKEHSPVELTKEPTHITKILQFVNISSTLSTFVSWGGRDGRGASAQVCGIVGLVFPSSPPAWPDARCAERVVSGVAGSPGGGAARPFQGQGGSNSAQGFPPGNRPRFAHVINPTRSRHVVQAELNLPVRSIATSELRTATSQLTPPPRATHCPLNSSPRITQFLRPSDVVVVGEAQAGRGWAGGQGGGFRGWSPAPSSDVPLCPAPPSPHDRFPLPLFKT